MEKLGAHLSNAHKQFEETSKAFDRFTNRLETIAEKADRRVESGESADMVPLLPPS
jgi:hypothetical protein